jgi:rubrerythrin
MQSLHPTSWNCPKCKDAHSKPHWMDHHQQVPGWKDKLNKHTAGKGSNPDYQYVCEECGTALTSKIQNGEHPDVEGFFCRTCHEPRLGVPAPLFCPHCGWIQERIVLERVQA